MKTEFVPAGGVLAQLSELQVSVSGSVVHVRLNRAAKRNAISDTLIQQLHTAFLWGPIVKAVGFTPDN